MKAIYRVVVAVFFAVSGSVQADDLGESYNIMCEKMKSCALKNIGEADLTPDLRAMVMASLEGACVSIQQQFNNVATVHPLYGPASACMKSMTALSCEQIENMSDEKTPECARYEKMAESYQ
ncbi:MAG: hypothetical protein ACJA1I_000881 [Zhongshania marina]|jgi:hypothetical protein